MLSSATPPSSASLVMLSTSDGSGSWRDGKVGTDIKKLSLAWELTDDVLDRVVRSCGGFKSDTWDPDPDITSTAGPEKSVLKSIKESICSCGSDTLVESSSFKFINEPLGVAFGLSSETALSGLTFWNRCNVKNYRIIILPTIKLQYLYLEALVSRKAKNMQAVRQNVVIECLTQVEM